MAWYEFLAKYLKGYLLMNAVALATNFISAFWVMLGLGAAHDLWSAIPAAGFWTTYYILTAVWILIGLLRNSALVVDTGE